jgi:hypothetical protein
MQGFWFAADDNVFDTFIESWALAIVRDPPILNFGRGIEPHGGGRVFACRP